MGDVKDLANNEAIEKLRELAKEETCLFCTYGEDADINSRPMSTQEVEDDGSLWFFSDKDSNKNLDIDENNKVYLHYSNPGKSTYLSIAGDAEIITDRAKIEELWSPLVKTWFQGGKDDPNITLLRVVPAKAYYWDTKHGKMIAFLKILAGAVSGKTMDDGIEGKLKI